MEFEYSIESGLLMKPATYYNSKSPDKISNTSLIIYLKGHSLIYRDNESTIVL